MREPTEMELRVAEAMYVTAHAIDGQHEVNFEDEETELRANVIAVARAAIRAMLFQEMKERGQ